MWNYKDINNVSSMAVTYIFYWINIICYPCSILVYILCIKCVNEANYKTYDELTTRAFSNPSGIMLGAGTFCLI